MANTKAAGLRRFLALLFLCAFVAGLPLQAAASSSSLVAGSSTATGSSESAAEAGQDSSASTPPGEGEETPTPPNAETLYSPEEPPLAAGVCLLNVETGMVAYEKNADQPLVAASLVKLMTCILVMECVERYGDDLDSTVVDSTNKGWVYDALYGKNASTADIRRGEVLSLRELLYATLLPSANEAALLLADYVSVGYMPNYMYMMNKRAQSLGCTGTTFDDPNGLSEANLTTARDMVLIMQEFMKYPELVEIAATPTYEMAAHEQHSSPYTIHTTDRLLVESSPYHKSFSSLAGALTAGKTGSLGTWQNFASCAAKGGETYICVVLNSPTEADTVGQAMEPKQNRPALTESAKLYEWAFANLTVRSALDTTEPVTELKVRYSTDLDTVMLLPTDDVKALMPKSTTEVQIQKKYDLPEFVAAPVQEGQLMGNVILSVGGREIGASRLVAARSVERNATLYVLNQAGDAFTSTYVKVLVCVVLGAGAAYAGLVALAANARSRRKKGGQRRR